MERDQLTGNGAPSGVDRANDYWERELFPNDALLIIS
jgi:hypothetical protein